MLPSVLSTQWLFNHLNDPNLVILDASPETNISGLSTDYPDLQIKSARYFDLKKDFSDPDSELPNTIPSPEHFQLKAQALGINSEDIIIVYDNIGIYTSPRVWWLFKIMGHRAIAVLNGGLPQWIKDGYATESINLERYWKKGSFISKFDASLLKNNSDIFKTIENSSSLIIDARSESRFLGTAPEPRKGLQSGHIPRSKNLPFQEVLNQYQLKPKEELLTLFNKLDIDDKPLIFSCGSGLTACIVMLAADQILNNPKSVYDGSWTEWAQLENSIIETNV